MKESGQVGGGGGEEEGETKHAARRPERPLNGPNANGVVRRRYLPDGLQKVLETAHRVPI